MTCDGVEHNATMHSEQVCSLTGLCRLDAQAMVQAEKEALVSSNHVQRAHVS